MNTKIQPLAAGKRRIKYNLENGCGDECSVTLDIPDCVTPRQRAGVAIFKARRTMPDEKPWRCTSHEEIAA